MNRDFIEVIAATPPERRDLFLGAARRLGTEQNVEKDFWVCWTLDALFNGLPAGAPRLLFKGGTSLSKASGLIARFSEDIDITVFRADLGQAAEVHELEKLSRKKREVRLDAIKAACQQYIDNQLLTRLRGIADETSRAAGINEADLRVSPDDEDPDRQSLLVWYPTPLVAARTADPASATAQVTASVNGETEETPPGCLGLYQWSSRTE